jgi:hypothetical protein
MCICRNTNPQDVTWRYGCSELYDSPSRNRYVNTWRCRRRNVYIELCENYLVSMIFIFVIKSQEIRRMHVSFRGLNECIVILWNSRNNPYPLVFQLSYPVWGLYKCLFRISKSRDAGERYRSSSTVSGRVTRLLPRQSTSRRLSQPKTSSSWQILRRRDSFPEGVTLVTSIAIIIIIITEENVCTWHSCSNSSRRILHN